MKTKDLVIIASFTAIIFAFEKVLEIVPNVQLTLFFIILLSKVLGFRKTIIIISLEVLIDNLISGFQFYIFIPMLIGLTLIPLLECTLFKKVNNIFIQILLGILYSFLYSWCFIIPFANVMGISIIDYFLADIPYELILALSTALSILILYLPLSKLLNKLLGGSNNEGTITSH